jgi:hypothetical protein
MRCARPDDRGRSDDFAIGCCLFSGGSDAHPWNETARVHRGAWRRGGLAAPGGYAISSVQPTAVQKNAIKSEIKGVTLAIKKERLP